MGHRVFGARDGYLAVTIHMFCVLYKHKMVMVFFKVLQSDEQKEQSIQIVFILVRTGLLQSCALYCPRVMLEDCGHVHYMRFGPMFGISTYTEVSEGQKMLAGLGYSEEFINIVQT